MMGQIPQNSRKEPRNSLDYFPTPPWSTRALLEFLKPVAPLKKQTVWEPACGQGHMVRPLDEYFKSVIATDIEDRRETFPNQDRVSDFLLDWPDQAPIDADWIITNPPFKAADQFIKLALKRAKFGVALIVKQQILEGIKRHRQIFNFMPPTWILQFAERVPMCNGRVDPEAKTNQSYMWLIWIKNPILKAKILRGDPNPRLHWIAPCRKKLERPGDYTFLASDRILSKDAPAPLFDDLELTP